MTESDKLQLMLRNAKQIQSVVAATFSSSFDVAGPSSDCETAPSEVDELACRWRSIMKALPGYEDGYKDTESWLYSTATVSPDYSP